MKHQIILAPLALLLVLLAITVDAVKWNQDYNRRDGYREYDDYYDVSYNSNSKYRRGDFSEFSGDYPKKTRDYNLKRRQVRYQSDSAKDRFDDKSSITFEEQQAKTKRRQQRRSRESDFKSKDRSFKKSEVSSHRKSTKAALKRQQKIFEDFVETLLNSKLLDDVVKPSPPPGKPNQEKPKKHEQSTESFEKKISSEEANKLQTTTTTNEIKGKGTSVSSEESRDSQTQTVRFPWGYSKDFGPLTWAKKFPAGRGKEQSPIAIKTKESEIEGYDRFLSALKVTYPDMDQYTVVNSGHGFKVLFDSDNNVIKGGPLDNSVFVLHHFELHWGKSQKNGSLHSIDGKSYAAELVFIHFNKNKYKTFEEASKMKDGLTYVSALVKLFPEDNESFMNILKALNKCSKKGATVNVVSKKHRIRFEDILPADLREYFTYPGSMIEPPLYESVNWIVLRRPIKMSADQLMEFRNFYPYNARPVQPLNNRVVRSSFNVDQISE